VPIAHASKPWPVKLTALAGTVEADAGGVTSASNE
jgi:hypothetical protein